MRASAPAAVPADDGLTAGWFTAVMRDAAGGAEVIDVRLEPMTTAEVGWFGRLLRAHLVYDVPDAGPATVVVKRDPEDDFVRDVGFDLGFFGREVNFYRELASAVPLQVPTCHYAAIDPATRRYVLVLEDLEGGRFGDQQNGCDVEELRVLTVELAALHAWGATIPPPEWAAASARQVGAPFADYDATFSTFAGHVSGKVPDPALTVGATLGARIDEIYSALDAFPATLTHADFRLDNVVFDLDVRPLVYDWQSTSVTPGALDLASLVVLSLEPDARRNLEDPMIDLYRAELAARGGAVDEDVLRRAYGLAIVHFFLLGVSALSTNPARPAFVTWARRTSNALAELDLDDLLSTR